MMRLRLLLVPALLAAAPAGAQAAPVGDSLAAIGAWVGKFAAISAEPGKAAATCGPKLGSVIAAVRDSATARAAVPQIRPCIEQIRAAYRGSSQMLAQFAPAPVELEAAANFDTRALIEDQRQQFIDALGYLDQLDAFLATMAANDRAGAARIFPKMRAGGAALIDGTILQLRAYRGVARFAFNRNAFALRILVAETTKLSMTGPMRQGGIAIGSELTALAPQARAAAAAVRTGWEQDKASLRALVGGDATMEPLIDRMAPTIETIAASGDAMAAALQRTGRQPMVPGAEMLALLNALNRNEIAVAKSVQDFAQTLQTIGK
jgi:hypothetical protein